MTNIFEVSLGEKSLEIDFQSISKGRKEELLKLTDYIQRKVEADRPILLNFICTHNSRRSHLAQIWAQAAAFHYNVNGVVCFSGGTEATAMFTMIRKTLESQGMEIVPLTEEKNTVYAVSFDPSSLPVIAFSKVYDHPCNPKSHFAAVMTCNHADENCPLIPGAEARIPITYDDPKAFDDSDLQKAKYLERSIQIASEMFFVFSQIKPR